MLKLLAKFLARPAVTDWLIRRALRTPYTHITATDGKGDYMHRFWLFNPYPAESSGKTNRFPISIRLHHIRRPDQDRDLHDHPWNARTFILRGGYVEQREDGAPIYRWEGETTQLRYGEFHRITQVSPGGVWTLFVTGRYRGTWGFKVDGAKVPWREYLGRIK